MKSPDETRWKTDRYPKQPTELRPESGCKLGAPVRDNVAGEAMETEDMLDQEFSCVLGKGEFGGKVDHFGEPVDNGEDNGNARRKR